VIVLATLRSIGEIEFPHRPSAEASLFVYEHQSHVPFVIERVFVVNAQEACKRGAHAHRRCTQLLVCLKGEIVLTLDDGAAKKTISMTGAGKGVLIPPGIWAEQEYEEGSVLMALTDRKYEEQDYIRDYDAFLAYRREAA
jgi:hypothetical protein